MPGTVKARGLVLDALGARPRLYELTVDPPGPGEVRVRVRAAGLCHTDVTQCAMPVHADPARARAQLLAWAAEGTIPLDDLMGRRVGTSSRTFDEPANGGVRTVVSFA